MTPLPLKMDRKEEKSSSILAQISLTKYLEFKIDEFEFKLNYLSLIKF